MRVQMRLGHRSWAVVAFTLWAAACSSDDSDPTPPESATAAPAAQTGELVTEENSVSVDDSEVPEDQTRAVGVGEQIVVSPEGRALLEVGGADFELLGGATIRLLEARRLEIRAHMDQGQLNVRLDDDVDQRVTVETISAVSLTTREAGTEFTACQSPATGRLTCLYVASGAVEWQALGESKIYSAGEATFALEGELPGATKCIPHDVFDSWFQAARRNEADADLGALVLFVSECDAAPSPGPSTSDAKTDLVVVLPTAVWTDTGIDVRSGDTLEITAVGAVSHAAGSVPVGPDGDPDTSLRKFNLAELPATDHAALVGRIGEDGTPFFVGRVHRSIIETDGRLLLGINDGGTDNNSGEFGAAVTVSR